jgi:channel protein (hemolysin III family)
MMESFRRTHEAHAMHDLIGKTCGSSVRLQLPCEPDPGQERLQSRGEEIANSLSHGVALLAAVAGVPFLFVHARPPEIASLIGVAVFATTMVLLYLCSTLYHAAPAGRAKRILLRFDLGAIYFFIAGSYTPFALGAVGGTSGWVMFGLLTVAMFVEIFVASVAATLMMKLWNSCHGCGAVR